MGDLRIVLFGKTGAGKSSLAKTIFEEEVFGINHTANSETSECQSATREVHGRNVTIIDTPGFFDSRHSEEDLRLEIAKCITECAPGPHAFFILLKVEKFTKHENEIISKIKENFSEEAFRHAVVVFTHGHQLPEGKGIQEFVGENEDLKDLLQKCGGRYHVVDNRYWTGSQPDEYRNNKIQVRKLLDTITQMVNANGGGFYTNEMLQAVSGLIQEEERRIQMSSGQKTWEEIKIRAKERIHNILKKAAGITTGMLLGALLGVPVMIATVVVALKSILPDVAAGSVMPSACIGGVALGAAVGGYVGYCEAVKADSAEEAAKNTAQAIGKLALKALSVLKQDESSEENGPLLKYAVADHSC